MVAVTELKRVEALVDQKVLPMVYKMVGLQVAKKEKQMELMSADQQVVLMIEAMVDQWVALMGAMKAEHWVDSLVDTLAALMVEIIAGLLVDMTVDWMVHKRAVLMASHMVDRKA